LTIAPVEQSFFEEEKRLGRQETHIHPANKRLFFRLGDQVFQAWVCEFSIIMRTIWAGGVCRPTVGFSRFAERSGAKSAARGC
jgi:hypothetical protein